MDKADAARAGPPPAPGAGSAGTADKRGQISGSRVTEQVGATG